MGIDRRGPKKWGIRYKGNQDKGKYGAGRGGDDQDAAGKKFTAEQGESRGKRIRQQGSAGAREQVTRDAKLGGKEETKEKEPSNPGLA